MSMALVIIIIILIIIFFSQKAKGSTPDPAPAYKAPPLWTRYAKAYNSQNEAELSQLVEEMIENHWAASYSYSSSHDDFAYNECVRYESAASKYPYIYKGSRENYRGMSLIEIFRKQNAEIESRIHAHKS